jgi:hypothetical protein
VPRERGERSTGAKPGRHAATLGILLVGGIILLVVSVLVIAAELAH